MNLIELLNELIDSTEDIEPSIEEKYSSFLFKRELNSTARFEKNLLRRIIDSISDRDKWLLNITVGENQPISLRKSEELDSFYDDLKKEWEYVEQEKIDFSLEIFKKLIEGKVTVYSFSVFDQFVQNLTTVGFLNVIVDDLKNHKILSFLIQTGLENSFYTRNIHFLQTNKSHIRVETIPGNENIFYLNEFCDFNYQQEHFFKPSIFRIISENNPNNNIAKKLADLATVFSLAGILDITRIEDDELEYKLNGYKVLKGEKKFSEISKESKQLYFEIWEWIYSNRSKISDKIGLVRNILTIYLSEDSLDIPQNAFFSIKSGYRTYLQRNIERYIEVRNKISEQLIDLTNNINTSVKEFLESYQKSNLLFISFFISVFIIRVLNTGSFTNVFTKDATILSIALLGISLLYWLFSLFKLNAEKARFEKKYSLIKNRFSDLLIEDDIDKILSGDEEFSDEIDYIKTQRLRYTVLWLLTLFILLASVLHLSTA